MKQKTFIALLFALLFNMISGGVISFASGLPFMAVFGSGTALSIVLGASGILKGTLNMALNVEIWHNAIIGNLFADNSFLSKAFNADEYVNGRRVHIPNAGRPSKTVKNRQDVPATASKRVDKDVEYVMNEFTTDPIYIPNIETVELSYNKRESAIREDRANLHEVVANDILYQWSPEAAYVLRTTGSAVASHLTGTTGFRKAFTTRDVAAAMTRFNADDVPQEGRYALVDAYMYTQLINSMTEKEATAFHALADLRNGIVGKLYTFNFMMRSKALIYNTALAPLEWTEDITFAETDNAGVLFWHDNFVCRSLGLVKMFGSEDNPLYYGDIYSFLLRAGGTIMRSDRKGILAVVQDAATEGYVAPSFAPLAIDVNTGEVKNAELGDIIVKSLELLDEISKRQEIQTEELSELQSKVADNAEAAATDNAETAGQVTSETEKASVAEQTVPAPAAVKAAKK